MSAAPQSSGTWSKRSEGLAAGASSACVAGPDVLHAGDTGVAASVFRAHWGLEPDLVFVNHGSYGATPTPVLQAQDRFRARMERDPVRFFKVDLERLMDGVRERIAQFMRCDPGGLAPVQNATVAICSVFANIHWKPGDEVLVTDHEYGSGLNELSRLAARFGIRVVTARVPFPIRSADQVYESVVAAVTDRTRLALISHITSATSLVFPVERIVPALQSRGVDVLVDGTHTPGQREIDLSRLAPAYFCGSFHKWVSAPKGTGFLWVREDRRNGFRTLALSSRANKVRPQRDLFLRDFDYMGTDDYTGRLAIPAALDFVGSLLPGGWPAVMHHNHELVLRGRDALCAACGLSPAAPDDMHGCMATLVLPEAPASLADRPTLYDDPLQDALYERHRVVVPIWRFDPTGARVIRLSAMIYNTLSDFERLGEALRQELARESAG
jgi:isopenicillin-N epimerase